MKLKDYIKKNWRPGHRYKVVVPTILCAVALGETIGFLAYTNYLSNDYLIHNEKEYEEVFGEKMRNPELDEKNKFDYKSYLRSQMVAVKDVGSTLGTGAINKAKEITNEFEKGIGNLKLKEGFAKILKGSENSNAVNNNTDFSQNDTLGNDPRPNYGKFNADGSPAWEGRYVRDTTQGEKEERVEHNGKQYIYNSALKKWRETEFGGSTASEWNENKQRILDTFDFSGLEME